MKQNRWKVLAVVIFMLAAGICYGLSRNQDETAENHEILLESFTEETGEEAAGQGQEPARTEEEESLSERDCYVHICGEVVKPGVYAMKKGDRIFQVVEEAGGYTEGAAKDYLNMAQEIQDGMKLTVPDQESVDNKTWEAEKDDSGAENSQKPEKIDINMASKEQLMTLRGIGEAKALDIIRYREERGQFQKIEDIMKISGIKEAAFEKIKDDITVK